jgi:uncharacterized damage-inducible protein DinB
MAESQREAVPRNDEGELDTSLAFLRFARNCLLKKLEGLDDQQVRRELVPTGTNLLGLVQHSTVGERYWFGHHLLGGYQDTDWDFTMTVPSGVSAARVLEGYRRAIEESDAAIAQVADPDAMSALPVDGAPKSLRWILAHATSETARHAGHADILREQIDGTTGR